MIAWWIVAILVTFPSAARASAPGPELRFHATRWTSEDGLPQMRISALAQTPDGYLWVGTWFGLARFDGVRFVVFNSANTPELRNEAITALAVDRDDGALWIGTTTGIVRFKDRQFARLASPHELANTMVHALVPAASGGVWAWTHAAVGLWRGEQPVAATLHVAFDEQKHSAWETEDGHFLVSTDRQCLELTPDGHLSRWSLPSGAPATNWLAGVVSKNHGQQIWLGLQRGLFCFTEGQWQEVQSFPARREPCDRLLLDRAGGVWAGCAHVGLFRCDAAGAKWVSLGNPTAEKSVNCLFQDQEGCVWVGTEGGLFRLRRLILQAVGVADGLPSEECRSVCEGPDGAIWVETAHGAARIKEGKVLTFPGEPERIPRFSVVVSPDEAIWLGNDHNGLVRWRLGGETNYVWHSDSETMTSGTTLESAYVDRAGKVWVGTDHGAMWFENGQPAGAWGAYGLPTNNVRSIYEARDGTMWFGTWQAGAVRWRSAGWQPAVSPTGSRRTAPAPSASADYQSATQQTASLRYFTTANGLADDRVFVFHEDADGALWIGTHNGLSRFKDGRWFTFRTEQGLFDNLINWLEEDDSVRFWFSSNRGIFRMDRAELNAVADGRKPRATATVYGVADGMLTPETNGEHQPAGCKARDGRLWFPTADGVVVIDPRAIEDSDLPPPAVIEQVVADDEVIFGDVVAAGVRRLTATRNSKLETRNEGPSLRSSAPTRLGPGRARVLQFRYTASSFADSKRTRFRYRLTPHDKDWREETTERVAYHTDLPPGDYRFEVKAAGARGDWNEMPAVFAFSLAPKFTQTLWFPLSGALALLAVTGGIVEWRLRWQRRAFLAEKNSAVERERGRIARDLHDDLGASLTGMALQLEAARRVGRAEGEQLAELAREARGVAHGLRELSWTTNPRCDNVGSLGVFLGELAERFCAAAGLECQLELPPADANRAVPARVRHDLLVFVKETLANVARHAGARSVTLQVVATDGHLRLTVRDDGAGFDPAQVQRGSGLRNLRERLEQAGGSCTVSSATTQGTVITATVPLDEPKERR